MEKGLDRFSKLDIFVYCGKVEEGCDYIKEESARVAPMLVARLISSILNDLACAPVRLSIVFFFTGILPGAIVQKSTNGT